MRYADGLATTLAGAAVPYGYTLVIWSSGSFAAHFDGRPDVPRIVLFVGGAAGAYAVLRVIARRGDVQSLQGIAERGLVQGGAIHIAAIAAALTAAALIARYCGYAAWPLAPAAATLGYLGGTAVNEAREIVAAERGER